MALAMSVTCLICSLGGGSSETSESDSKVLRSRRIREGGNGFGRSVRRAERIDGAGRSDRLRAEGQGDGVSSLADAVAAKKERADEERLSALAEHVIQQLKDAAWNADLPRLQKLIAAIFANPRASLCMGSVPVAVRRQIVESLGMCGVAGLPELVEFIGDENPSVAKEALEMFETRVDDFSLSDVDRAPLIVAAAKIVSDPMELTGLMQNMTLLRNSLKVDVFAEILKSGTAAAQEAVRSKMQTLTGEENLTSAADGEDWLERNPDGENDDVWFGGKVKHARTDGHTADVQ